MTDRYASRLVFSNYTGCEHSKSLVHSLSSHRDLMADGAYNALGEIVREVTLPELSRSLAPENVQNPLTNAGPLHGATTPPSHVSHKN